MDSVTERILARARERQRLLENYPSNNKENELSPNNNDNIVKKSTYLSQPNLNDITTNNDTKIINKDSVSDSNIYKNFVDNSNIEGNNIRLLTKHNSTTHISSEITSLSSPQSTQMLNIKNDNFNMEIKVSSLDNVRVEVQIEEENSDESTNKSDGLRPDAKNRLNRLGQLYSDDAQISSPIHRSEEKFYVNDSDEMDTSPIKSTTTDETKSSKRGLSKLADLAQNMNQWEDDYTHVKLEKPVVKKSWKAPAPPPPVNKDSPVKVKARAPNPPEAGAANNTEKKSNSPKRVQWDQKVLDNLESQGFTRTTSSSRLVYNYNNSQEKEKNEAKKIQKIEEKDEEHVTPKSPKKHVTKTTGAIADRAAIFEQRNNNNSPNIVKEKEKDPALLSVSERKALFEKNKGAALVPKSAFGMATPAKTNVTPKKYTKSPAPAPPQTQSQPSSSSSSSQKLADKVEEMKEESKFDHKPMIHSVKEKEKEIKAAVPQGKGVANTVAMLLEAKSTISQEQIVNSVREQRQKEMEVLLNRFNRSKEPPSSEIIQEVDDNDDDDIDNEFDESDEDATEKTAMIKEKPSCKIVPPPPPPPCPSTSEKRLSGGGTKRCSKGDSPKVAAILSDVKRIKVTKKDGRLYPSLTDIESQTETENDEIDHPSSNESSFCGSTATADSDDINTSFGRDILRTVVKNQTPYKRPFLDTSSDMSDVLDGADDYIDEAMAFDESEGGPTPPKLGRQGPQQSNSFHYKSFNNKSESSPSQFNTPNKKQISPRKSDDFNVHIVDGNNVLPLTHTVSFYRKQQSQSANNTPIRHITRETIKEEERGNNINCVSSDDEEQIIAKLKELQNEVNKQQTYIAQASQALNVCNSRPEFVGSPEQVEAERLLLIATHRRQAALHELQRLEVERTLRPQGQHSKNLPLEKGSLTISRIVLPLKQKYVTALAAAGGKGHHVICLIKCGEQVIDTPLVSTVVTNAKNPDLELKIPGTVKLNNIYSDFTITFEVYCLQAQEEILPHDVKYHINKKACSKLLTPKKSKQDKDNRLIGPIKESPAGPNVVRSSTFALMGYVVFSVQAINKKQWTLNNTPSMSPLEGTVSMHVTCELAVSVEHRGFLTMFEDVSGFGAWHRRWCLLQGHCLSYWKYPDDEKKTPPIDTINLKQCITTQVGPVNREICARLHTFLLERERMAQPKDRDTLVMVRKGDKTITRHLLSSDTKEERIEWCRKLNAALTALRMWGDKD